MTTKRVKAGNGQAAAAARRGVFVQAYIANGHNATQARHVGDARVYADIQTRRHTCHTLEYRYRRMHRPRWRTARIVTAHGAYMEGC